jgi:hypothetical protein
MLHFGDERTASMKETVSMPYYWQPEEKARAIQTLIEMLVSTYLTVNNFFILLRYSATKTRPLKPLSIMQRRASLRAVKTATSRVPPLYSRVRNEPTVMERGLGGEVAVTASYLQYTASKLP